MAIMESRSSNSSSMGYTINLTGLSKNSMQQIRQLIKNYPLEVNEGDDYLIVYTPRVLEEEV